MLVEEGRTALNSSFMLTAFQATLFSLAITTTSILDKIYAATIEAKSVSFADVSSAVAAAKDGDTVSMPRATATWPTALEVTKNITLQGAGPGLTVIVDAVPNVLRRAGGNKRPSRGALLGLQHFSPANGRSSAPRLGGGRPNAL